MKKPFAKQIILGAMALTLVGGGGYILKGHDVLAATTATTTDTAQTVTPQQDNHAVDMVRKVNDDLITFLKLEKSVYQEKITSGKTLAEIAAEQGISRDDLKAELTKEVNADLDQEKADFALNLDKTVDSKQLGEVGRGGPGGREGGQGGGHIKADLTTVATALGFTTIEELHTALGSDKSIADLAAAKNITVQSLIDLQVVAITAALDKDLASGKLTKADYDEKKAEVTAEATKVINDKHDGKDGGPGGRGGKGGPGGFGGKNRPGGNGQRPDPSSTPTATS
jgi:hypothetical protein